MGEIQKISLENQETISQIYHMKDFYDSNLLPKMFAFPHQYVARIISNSNYADVAKKI